MLITDTEQASIFRCRTSTHYLSTKYTCNTSATCCLRRRFQKRHHNSDPTCCVPKLPNSDVVHPQTSPSLTNILAMQIPGIRAWKTCFFCRSVGTNQFQDPPSAINIPVLQGTVSPQYSVTPHHASRLPPSLSLAAMASVFVSLYHPLPQLPASCWNHPFTTS